MEIIKETLKRLGNFMGHDIYAQVSYEQQEFLWEALMRLTGGLVRSGTTPNQPIAGGKRPELLITPTDGEHFTDVEVHRIKEKLSKGEIVVLDRPVTVHKLPLE